MMNYAYMMGAGGGGALFLSWIVYVLTIILLILGVGALWKYINKK